MTKDFIPDIQNTTDQRNLPINKVGIRALRYPIHVAERAGHAQATVGLFNMYVALPATVKGTHMSRFVEMLQQNPARIIHLDSFQCLVEDMVTRLDATSGSIQVTFPYFINKRAPVSGATSLLDYEVTYSGEVDDKGYRFTMKVLVPVTSLCPCSKEISQYGAHNQRSHVTLTALINQPIWVEELIDIVEEEASCQLYGLLKRSDEKFVTEQAYTNPKFVEDVVRDIAARLNAEQRLSSFIIESENFESIHNHSAYALIANE